MKFVKSASFIFKIVCIVFCFNSCNSKATNVRLKCLYMAYACGDCYPQYKIQELYEPKTYGREIIGKDLDVSFESREEESKFEQEVGACGICYSYDFKGNLSYSYRKKCYELKVFSYSLKMENKDCCSTPVMPE